MIEVLGFIVAAVLLASGYWAIDATPQGPVFTYPCLQEVQDCE